MIVDIDDAVRFLCERHRVDRVALVGGSWGSVTTSLYASTIGAARVSRLVLYAPIYAAHNPGWIAELEDKDAPGTLDPRLGASRRVSGDQVRARWDAELPEGADWRDDAVLAALVDATLADEGAPGETFVAPNGTLVDLWECFNDRPLYEPAAIACPTLLVRGGADTTSTRSDALALLDRIGSRDKRYLEIAEGTHFLTAERSARRIFETVAAFLSEDQGPSERARRTVWSRLHDLRVDSGNPS